MYNIEHLINNALKLLWNEMYCIICISRMGNCNSKMRTHKEDSIQFPFIEQLMN